MSITAIPEQVRFRLWGKAAGRCQYEGCNKPLWLDPLTKTEFNVAYIAHIIADKPKGPRGDSVLSEKLKDDISNLMLMCDEHHRLIDKKDIDGHPVNRLKAMKERHEKRIELLSSIDNDMRSHVLFYAARIGEHYSNISFEIAAMAMVPHFFPTDSRAIELSLKNSSFTDHEATYWHIEEEHLSRQFTEKVKSRLAVSDIKHLSIFALAPIPLLVKLGSLLSDIPTAEIYQLHREPPNWSWQTHYRNEFIVKYPNSPRGIPAINLSLSATIDDSRISSTFTTDHSIWHLTVKDIGNDFLKSRDQLAHFRQAFRRLLDRMKAKHSEASAIHIYPAIPVSIAVEIGRVWMPKADLPLIIYEQNRKVGGFYPALKIS
ncbi:MAG: SAVED domain-containing protein [Deltaproteobacteria bacterium]|nr:SAVED domain-containing protein [Deltaproteobacteria bacterium]